MSSMLQTGEPIGRRDIVIAAVLSLLGLVLIYSDAVEPKINASYLAIPAFLAVTVPLVWRRSAPLLALGVTLIALAAHVLLFGEMTRCGIVFPLTWILVFAAAVRLAARSCAGRSPARLRLHRRDGQRRQPGTVRRNPAVPRADRPGLGRGKGGALAYPSGRRAAREHRAAPRAARRARSPRGRDRPRAALRRAGRAASATARRVGAARRRRRRHDRRRDRDSHAREHRAGEPPDAPGDASAGRSAAK